MNDLDPRVFLSIFFRRFPIFLLTAVVIFSGFAAAAVLLPATFTSSAKILVESQQIPSNLVQSTVTSHASERLRVIQQRLMTRENLLEIASEFGVFRERRDLSPSEMVQAMRDASDFQIVGLGGGRGGGMALTFTVSFSATRPNIAARVASEYVERILEDNLKLRTARAANTFEFFEQESERLANEINAIEGEIVDFKRANRDTLPETLQFRTNDLQRIQQRLQLIDREKADLSEQRDQLAEYQRNPQLLADQGETLSDTEKTKAQLERQLEMRLALLSEDHPEIRALRTRIGSLERLIESEAERRAEMGEEAVRQQVSERMERVNAELERIDTRLSQLEDEQASLERQEAELERSIAETPNTEMALRALQRNYNNLQQQYNAARDKLALSATGEQLELKQQAERFEVIEQATVPESPDKPDRMMILVMGVGGGAGAGLGLIVLLEFLNKAVRRPSDVIAAIDQQPLAVIPYIFTDDELRRRSRVKWAIIILTVGGGTALLALIHLYYLPLDLLARRIMERTQIDSLLEIVQTRLNM
ncbi:MAG: GumC family protein [Pseudomonadota bacterium]